MSPARLHYVCSDRGIPVDGHKGASVHVREIARALARTGLRPHVFVARYGGDVVESLDFTVAKGPRRSGHSVVDELGDFVDQHAMAAALEAASAPEAVIERCSLFGLAGLRHALRHDVPFVLEVNAPLWEEAARFRALDQTDLAMAVARTLLARADHVLAVSPRLKERLVEAGATPARVHVFPNGVAPAFVQSGPVAERPAAFGARPILAFVGSLKPWHGIDFVLDAMEAGRLGDAALWIVGDGPLRARAEDAARRRPDRVHVQGAVPHTEVASILRASDAALAPYHADAPDYFCPLKVVEALCTGVPLVAADVVAVRHVVPTDANVHWFAAGSTDDLVRGVRDALDAGRRGLGSFDPLAHTWDARARELAAITGLQPRLEVTA